MSTSKTYLIKIYKPGTKLYRTALVPGSTRLDQLHEAIHEWMEFPTYEMYGFFLNNKMLSESGYYAPQMQKKRSADQVCLDDLGLFKGQRILYVYDMTELMQFYIHIDEIEDRLIPEIQLLRRNGHLTFYQEPEADPSALLQDPDTWRVEDSDLAMLACIASNDIPELLDTAHALNVQVRSHWSAEQVAEAIYTTLQQDPGLAIRMMPLHILHFLEVLWQSAGKDVVTVPFEFLLRMSLLGFVLLDETESDRVVVCSEEARQWFSEILERPANVRMIEKYSRWNAVARGMLYSYGVIQMDDFYQIFCRYIEETPDIDEVCDFMMQRMEWNEECNAVQDEKDLYWSTPAPEKAAIILEKRKETPMKFKKFTRREIIDNAETAGWQHVDCGQELFEALQGAAMENDEVREVLQEIVRDFTKGMEPSEILRDCIPPVTQIGRVAHNKIRMMLREVKRQLPDYTFMGYSIREMESRKPEMRMVEGLRVIKGKK